MFNFKLDLKRLWAKLVAKSLNFCKKKKTLCRCFSIMQWLFAKNSTNIAPHDPYCPEMSPSDFFLFSQLMKSLWRTRFDSVESRKQKSKELLTEISKSEHGKCFQNWIKRWRMRENKLWVNKKIVWFYSDDHLTFWTE